MENIENICTLTCAEFREVFLSGIKDIPEEIDYLCGVHDGTIYAARVCGEATDDNWEITHAGLEVIRGNWVQ